MDPARLAVSTGGVGHPTDDRQCKWSPEPAGAPSPCWRAAATDRERMDAALKTLRRYGITTSAAVARPGAPDGIAEQLAQRIRARFPFADGACVFWTADDDSRCFAPSGHLREPLTVHTYGPGAADAAAAALEAVGLVVRSEGPSASAVSVDTASDRAS